eukprot:Gb_09590 [translate_table: standard]
MSHIMELIDNCRSIPCRSSRVPREEREGPGPGDKQRAQRSPSPACRSDDGWRMVLSLLFANSLNIDEVCFASKLSGSGCGFPDPDMIKLLFKPGCLEDLCILLLLMLVLCFKSLLLWVGGAVKCSQMKQGMFSRTIRLLEAGVLPVYVFDGNPPVLKKEELAKRQVFCVLLVLSRREEAISDLAQAIEIGDKAEIEKYSKRTVKVNAFVLLYCNHWNFSLL